MSRARHVLRRARRHLDWTQLVLGVLAWGLVVGVFAAAIWHQVAVRSK